jgi:hypothetical protein
MTLVLTREIGELGGEMLENSDEFDSRLPTDEEQPSRDDIGRSAKFDALFWQL